MLSPCSVKTTVVIPVYNTEEYLPACLDSVLAQTQREIEVILVDDGSTDGSLEIERSYADRDPRVRVIEQPNLRQGTARNRGLAEAQGEYVYFMDSDDLIVPELFETCYRTCKEGNLDFVTFDSAGFRDDPNIERPELFEEMQDRSRVVTTEILDGPTFWGRYFVKAMTPFLCWLEYFDRSFLNDNDLRFVEGIYFEDNDWIARVFLSAKRMRYIPMKLHRYRDRPGSNVHAGFTHVLADSCFDVHAILCALAREEDEPSRLQILKDVSAVKDIRFRQFKELEPTKELSARAVSCAEVMRQGCLDHGLPQDIRMMHLLALLSLAQGVASWPDTPIPVSKDLVVSALLGSALEGRETARLGIYGMGKVCNAFLNVFDVGAHECVFLETVVSPGSVSRGLPVVQIDAAAGLGLDIVIIASTKYADEMRRSVARYLGNEIPVCAIPREILRVVDMWAFDEGGVAR